MNHGRTSVRTAYDLATCLYVLFAYAYAYASLCLWPMALGGPMAYV